jgi:hypothetical protein
VDGTTAGTDVERNDSGTAETPGTGIEPERKRSGTALTLSDGDDADCGFAAANCEYELLMEGLLPHLPACDTPNLSAPAGYRVGALGRSPSWSPSEFGHFLIPHCLSAEWNQVMSGPTATQTFASCGLIQPD